MYESYVKVRAQYYKHATNLMVDSVLLTTNQCGNVRLSDLFALLRFTLFHVTMHHLNCAIRNSLPGQQPLRLERPVLQQRLIRATFLLSNHGVTSFLYTSVFPPDNWF